MILRGDQLFSASYKVQTAIIVSNYIDQFKELRTFSRKMSVPDVYIGFDFGLEETAKEKGVKSLGCRITLEDRLGWDVFAVRFILRTKDDVPHMKSIAFTPKKSEKEQKELDAIIVNILNGCLRSLERDVLEIGEENELR